MSPYRQLRYTLAAVVALLASALTHAQPDVCDATSDVIETITQRAPALQETGIKPRLAIVRIGTSAGKALGFATDAGWSPEDRAPLEAIRDLRDLDATPAELRTRLRDQVAALTEVMAKQCPM
ncbi:MAG: hypothetical protein RIC89_05060 [Pseudomonadales bacterium]